MNGTGFQRPVTRPSGAPLPEGENSKPERGPWFGRGQSGIDRTCMAQERVLISSEPGKVTAELVDNNATRALLRHIAAHHPNA